MADIVYEANNNLYLNITNRCTANCIFCLKHHTNGAYGYNLKLEQEPTLEEVLKTLERFNLHSYQEIVFTGLGEPLLRLELVLDITRWLKKHGCKQVRIDTNGHAPLIHPHRNVATELAQAGIDTVSISLNAHNQETYNLLCQPKFKNAFSTILAFARQLKKTGIKTRFTIVDLPMVDIKTCQKLAQKTGADFKIRKYSKPPTKPPCNLHRDLQRK